MDHHDHFLNHLTRIESFSGVFLGNEVAVEDLGDDLLEQLFVVYLNSLHSVRSI